jgi:hypothetical protein
MPKPPRQQATRTGAGLSKQLLLRDAAQCARIHFGSKGAEQGPPSTLPVGTCIQRLVLQFRLSFISSETKKTT